MHDAASNLVTFFENFGRAKTQKYHKICTVQVHFYANRANVIPIDRAMNYASVSATTLCKNMICMMLQAIYSHFLKILAVQRLKNTTKFALCKCNFMQIVQM